MSDTPAGAPSHENTITLNFGPQHPAAHGVLRMVLELSLIHISEPTRH